MTEGNQWFDVPLKLYKKGIAEPVLWTGDDCHYQKAEKFFGKIVFKDLLLKHRPYNIIDVDYNGEYYSFFESENYLIAKDRCLKMMDRIDLYGTMSRIDREAYFHNLAIWALKNIDKTKPDFLLASENPHGHAQYLIYQLCIYLDIPIYKFANWNLAPLIFLQNELTKEIIPKPSKPYNDIDKKIEKDLEEYCDLISDSNDKFEFPYMKNQKMRPSNFLTFLVSGLLQ